MWICGRVLRTGASPAGRVDKPVDNADALPTASPTLSRLSPTSSTGPTTSDSKRLPLTALRFNICVPLNPIPTSPTRWLTLSRSGSFPYGIRLSSTGFTGTGHRGDRPVGEPVREHGAPATTARPGWNAAPQSGIMARGGGAIDEQGGASERPEILRLARGDPRRRRDHRGRRVRRAGGAVRLRQVDPAADDRGSRANYPRQDPARRQGREQSAPEGTRLRDGVPELRALPPHDRVRQHGVQSPAAPRRQAGDRPPRAGDGGDTRPHGTT